MRPSFGVPPFPRSEKRARRRRRRRENVSLSLLFLLFTGIATATLCCCIRFHHLRIRYRSHLYRFLFLGQEDLVENKIDAFRSFLFPELVFSYDFLLSFLGAFEFHLSHFHVLFSQAFVSFYRSQCRKLLRFPSFVVRFRRPRDV